MLIYQSQPLPIFVYSFAMRNWLIISVMALLAAPVATAQKYLTRTGTVSFFSNAPMEDITAQSSQMTAVLNGATGELAFTIQIQSFEFDKALMQEHFNENYMESAKYPKATFSGNITDNSAVNYSKNGSYNVTVKGKLTIHGVTKEVSVTGTLTVNGNKVICKSTFQVKLADYGIKNDKIQNISDTIAITVNSEMTQQ